jgi:hypothetical protein
VKVRRAVYQEFLDVLVGFHEPIMKGNLGGSRLAFSRKVNAALFGITFQPSG